MSKKPEIVAPGWSWEKAMIAARYGADAVYVWVPFLSLRMRQNKIRNFDTLKKTIDDLHSLGVKAYLTINIFPRNTDIKVIEAVIDEISWLDMDAVIFSDPGVFTTLKKYLWNKVRYHLSTQTNTLNWMAVKFWTDLWVDRIIVARELWINEIKEIKEKVPEAEIEAFVHGAMCMTYSWRCLLGEYFSWRDGNKWECSHVCRYKFNVYLEEEKRPGKLFKVEEDETGSFLLSSKDLCTIEHRDELLNIDAWKIEWRSKSEFYVWSTTKAYSHLRDCLVEWKEPDREILDLVYKIPHRQYWDGFLFNDIRTAPESEEDAKKNLIQTTTKTEAGPLPWEKTYIWTTTDKFIEKNGMKYYKIAPKNNIFVWDEFDVLDNTWKFKKTKIIWILDENKEIPEKLTCNMKQAYIAGDNLKEWNILVK
jgi:putative protease